MIRHIKNFDFTRQEVADLLDLIDHDPAFCHVMAGKMQKKVEMIDRKIRELRKSVFLAKTKNSRGMIR